MNHRRETTVVLSVIVIDIIVIATMLLSDAPTSGLLIVIAVALSVSTVAGSIIRNRGRLHDIEYGDE